MASFPQRFKGGEGPLGIEDFWGSWVSGFGSGLYELGGLGSGGFVGVGRIVGVKGFLGVHVWVLGALRLYGFESGMFRDEGLGSKLQN